MDVGVQMPHFGKYFISSFLLKKKTKCELLTIIILTLTPANSFHVSSEICHCTHIMHFFPNKCIYSKMVSLEPNVEQASAMTSRRSDTLTRDTHTA
jgi:hypothetical protein